MSQLPLLLTAVLLYTITVAGFSRQVVRGPDGSSLVRPALLLVGLLAIGLHAAVLFSQSYAQAGLDLRFFNAASLVGWLMALMVLIAALRLPVDTLVVVVLPIGAVMLLLSGIVYEPVGQSAAATRFAGLDLHVVSSILAFSVLNVAVLQALALAYQDRQLRRRRVTGLVRLLPPLSVMETLLFQILSIGFLLLTVSLASGWLFLEDLLAQHLVHKTVLSVLAWLLFGGLLLGRSLWGWRGRLAIRWTLGGFLALMLAYFGTKLVLELILQR